MCFNLRNMAYVDDVKVKEFSSEELRPVMDDVSSFETLCPVSSLTGHRSNPLDALQMVLKPDKARLLENVLQEIPPSGVPSDIGTFEFLADRLSLGTDAERAVYVKKLSSVADELYRIQPSLKSDSSIEFTKVDGEVHDKNE